MVAREGFEPSKALANGFTVRPLWPLGNLANYPYSVLKDRIITIRYYFLAAITIKSWKKRPKAGRFPLAPGPLLRSNFKSIMLQLYADPRAKRSASIERLEYDSLSYHAILDKTILSNASAAAGCHASFPKPMKYLQEPGNLKKVIFSF
jgi:hypothetical protein